MGKKFCLEIEDYYLIFILGLFVYENVWFNLFIVG